MKAAVKAAEVSGTFAETLKIVQKYHFFLSRGTVFSVYTASIMTVSKQINRRLI
jgi:hypothetical protein